MSKTQSLCPHSRMIHAEDSGPGVGARCLHLVEQIVKRYGPKVSNVKSYALTKEERLRLFDSGAMIPPDTTMTDAAVARLNRYKYGRKVAITEGNRPPGKPPLHDVAETTKEALAHVKRYGHAHGYLKRLARLRGVNYNTLFSSFSRAQADAIAKRRNAA